MPRPATFPDLHDADWLRARYVDEGLKHREIARLIGCSDVAVGKALQRYGVKRPPGRTPPEAAPARHGEPEPVRAFAPLASRLQLLPIGSSLKDSDYAQQLADLDADVAADELARRLPEGLTDLAELTRLAAQMPRERLWGLVVDRVDAATARACVRCCGGGSGPIIRRPRPA